MTNFAEQREYMVERQLLPCEVLHPHLLRAASQVPRESFLPEDLKHLAYIDDDICLDEIHYMLRPTDLMRMIQALEITTGDRVLDVGCSRGYSTFILSYLAKRVVGLDELERFIDKAREMEVELGITSVKFVHGSYRLGYVDESPYNAILVQRAFEKPPEALLEQLDVGGRLVYIHQTDQYFGQAMLLEKLHSHISQRPLFELCAPHFNATKTRFTFE